MVQSDWLLRGPLFHLETSAEVFYRGPLIYMYLPMAIYVEVIVTMMQCIIKNNFFKSLCVLQCSFAAIILLLQLPIASALVQS